MAQEIAELVGSSLWMIVGIAVIFAVYLAVSALCYFLWSLYSGGRDKARGFTSLKTVTFGDESAVVPNRLASIAAVITIFLLWAIATGSSLLPFSLLPGPHEGETSFEYTATNGAGETGTGTITLLVHQFGEKPDALPLAADNGDFAQNQSVTVAQRRKVLIKVQEDEGFAFTAIDGQPVEPGAQVDFEDGNVLVTQRGSLSIEPDVGMTMEALYLPPPEAVWSRFIDLNQNGYQGVGLWENVFWSLVRVVVGFALGCLFGIPLGFAMGLNGWLRGWFDPIVEFMRPVPPLALIPLIIIWFGIGEQGKISLLFLAALWIMTIAARAGVSGVNISKVHAAYSLGATKRQILSKVILPNSLPEIFTGARVAMGVCWGTVVAAELVAAEKGAGKMIIAASKFQLTDIVIIGIIIIGVIGYGIDMLMRGAENKLVPWKGRG
jgi:taurine transport system permease protein